MSIPAMVTISRSRFFDRPLVAGAPQRHAGRTIPGVVTQPDCPPGTALGAATDTFEYGDRVKVDR
jgi:hypothetical protein